MKGDVTLESLKSDLEKHEATCQERWKHYDENHQYLKDSLEKIKANQEKGKDSTHELDTRLTTAIAVGKNTRAILFAGFSVVSTFVIGIVVHLVIKGLA